MVADPKVIDEMKTILFTNLQILDMNIVDMEETYKIPFNKDMFNLPNKSGSEVVLHYLFGKLNPSTCRELFRDCWPVLDRKTELQFRKVCANWLSSIQKDDVESHLPHVSGALLLSPGGRKFIHLLYSFSTYVLGQVMKSEHGCEIQHSIVYPTMNQRTASLGPVISSVIQDSVIREKNEFFEHLQLTVIANRQWKDYTNELVKEFRGLTKANRELELEKRQQVNILADSAIKQDLSLPAKRTITMFDSDHDAFAIKRGQRMEKAKSQWSSLTKFNDRMSEQREIFQSILNNTAAKFTIDGTEMGIRVPGLLLRECSKEMLKHEIENIYNGGALNLVSLVQLWNICLNMYKGQLETETLPSVSLEVPRVSAQAHKHHSHLRHTQELREKMKAQTLPKLKRSIVRLQKKLNNQGAYTTSTDNNANRLGLVLTGPTPPSTNISRNAVNDGDTPRGPVAGRVVHSGGTPDALQNVNSKIEMALRKDTEASQVLKDIPALTRLINIQQRSIGKRGVNVSKSHVKEEQLKSGKSLGRSKVFNSNHSAEIGTGIGTLTRNMTPHQTTQAYQNSKKFVATSDSSIKHKTPQQRAKTSQQRAVDILADTVVNSVLNSSDSTDFLTTNANTLYEFGELGVDEIFETKNMIKRSPVKSDTLFQNPENQQTSGGARPKTFSAHKNGTDSLHNQWSDYIDKKSHQTSFQHESVFSQNSKDVYSSFDSDIGELDWSNNAALGEGSWLPKGGHMSRDSNQSHQNSLNEVAQILDANDSLSKSIIEAVKYSAATQLIDFGTTSPKTPRSLKNRLGEKANSAFTGLFNSDWLNFNSSDTLDKSLETHENDKDQQKSQTFNFASSVVSDRLIVANSSLTSEENSSPDLTKTSQNNIYHLPSDLLQDRLTAEKTYSDVEPGNKSVCEKKISVVKDISDRQPGDGQSNSNQTVQQVPVVWNDSDTDTEEMLDTSRLHTLSPYKSESNSLSTSSMLTAPIYDRLKNAVSDGHDVLFTKTDEDPPTTEVALPSQQESELIYSHENLINFGSLLNKQVVHKSCSSSSLTDFFKVSEDKLLDLEDNNMPLLVNLDSEDEDFEQAFNDSYVPVKEGIHLDSKSPAKHRFTPSKARSEPLSKSDDSELSSKYAYLPPPEGNIQMKMALLQQKAMDILSNYSEDYELLEESSSAGNDTLSKKSTNQCNQADAEMGNAINTDVKDLMST